jgi:hypothetical protein
MVQTSAVAGVTVKPETAHAPGVSERNDTVSPVGLEGDVAVTDAADNVTGWPTVVSCGWSKVIVCGRPAGPTADLGIPATAAATWACGRPTTGPPATAAKTQNPRTIRSQDQRTVEREATLPASLLRSGTFPIGCRPMTVLLAWRMGGTSAHRRLGLATYLTARRLLQR